MYWSKEEMMARKRFKEMELLSWFKSKRGGGDKKIEKDIPSTMRVEKAECIGEKNVEEDCQKKEEKERQRRQDRREERWEKLPEKGGEWT